MMDTGLQGMDLSLFGGDLLIGGCSSEYDLNTELYDGKLDDWTKTEPPKVVQIQDEKNTLQSPLKSPGGIMDVQWLDSRVDLLDLLSQEGEFVLDQQHPSATTSFSTTTQDDMESLQTIAYDPTEISVENTNEITLTSGNEEDNVVTSVDVLLDMLSTGGVAENTESPSTSLEPLSFDSTLLTPVSEDEFESILSVDPISSSVTYETHPQQQTSVAPKKKSLLAQYLIGELDTRPSPGSVVIYPDSEEMVQEVEDEDDPDYLPSPSATKARISTGYRRGRPPKSSRPLDKKLRKKQQNKDAATRYRIKKRYEKEVVHDELSQLEKRNTELKDKVGQMTSEISYLKDLLSEVYKARGMKLPKIKRASSCAIKLA